MIQGQSEQHNEKLSEGRRDDPVELKAGSVQTGGPAGAPSSGHNDGFVLVSPDTNVTVQHFQFKTVLLRGLTGRVVQIRTILGRLVQN